MKRSDIRRIITGVCVTATIIIAGSNRFQTAHLPFRDTVIIDLTVGSLFLAFILFVNRADLMTLERTAKRWALRWIILGGTFLVVPYCIYTVLSIPFVNIVLFSGLSAGFCWLIAAFLLFVSIFGGNKPGSIGPTYDHHDHS